MLPSPQHSLMPPSPSPTTAGPARLQLASNTTAAAAAATTGENKTAPTVAVSHEVDGGVGPGAIPPPPGPLLQQLLDEGHDGVDVPIPRALEALRTWAK